jgi:Mg-chelatase subunit ChlD
MKPRSIRRVGLFGVLAASLVALPAVAALGPTDPPASRGTASGRPGAISSYAHIGTWRLPQGPSEPLDLAFGPTGDLYVADGLRRVVMAFHANGERWASWPSPAIAEGMVPIAVTFDPVRQLLYTLWQRYDPAADGGAPQPGPLYLDRRAPDGGTDNAVLSLQFLPGGTDMAMDPTTNELLVLSGDRVTRIRMPGATRSGGFAVDTTRGLPTRLAVLADGRVALAGSGMSAVALYDPAGIPAGQLETPEGSPVALALEPGGALQVLLQAAARRGPDTPLLVTFSANGTRIASRVAGALGVPPVPPGGWPWSLAASPDGLAFSTGAARFLVARFSPGWAPAWTLSGRWVRARFTPLNLTRGSDPTLALAVRPDDGLEVLDPDEGRVLAYDSSGRASVVGAVPVDAVDLAVDDEGRRFVSTAGGQLWQLAPGDEITPTWQVACDCSLGGRLATGTGVVYATQPRTLTVGTFDALAGLSGRSLQLPDAVGLWPADVASGSDGRLYTADLVTAQVHAWRADEAPVGWPAGLLAGPRRLTGGHLADDTPVIASLQADNQVELHGLDGNLAARFAPRLSNNELFSPVDIAMDTEGLVWLADAHARAVHLFAPSAGVPSTPETPPTPAPTSDTSCHVVGDKVAAPSQVIVGQSVGVTLTLAASCPDRAKLLGADILLVIDRSTSMSTGGLSAAQDAARAFIEMLDVRYHRVGLASFSDDASIDVPLTTNVPVVIDGLGRLVANGQTNLAAAVSRAQDNLVAFGRQQALPVIVLLTDGRLDPSAADPRPTALDARNAGTQIYTIGLGSNVDQPLLRDLAGRPDHYFFAPTAGDLFPIYSQILRLVLSSLAGNLIIDDSLADDMAYIEGSAKPPALVAFGRLSWGRSLLPATGITFTYRLRTTRPGCQPTNREAKASFTDADGQAREFVFPVPTICAVAPTPTATRVPTATATATPKPVAIHLPILFKSSCVPGTAHADVVLLIDTSDSMVGEKLNGAKFAAIDFVNLLNLPADQASIIGFNSSYQIASGLTGSRPALISAIQHLANGRGTQIDRALRAAVNELRGGRHKPLNRSVIILLSDGQHNGDPADVLAAASDARADKMVVYAIGLGSDVDVALLSKVAGSGRYFPAANPSSLSDIYRSIAGIIPCR